MSAMPNPTPPDDPHDPAPESSGAAETRWHDTLAAALRVIDHHVASLASKRTLTVDAPATNAPAESPAGEHEPQ